MEPIEPKKVPTVLVIVGLGEEQLPIQAFAAFKTAAVLMVARAAVLKHDACPPQSEEEVEHELDSLGGAARAVVDSSIVAGVRLAMRPCVN